MDSLARLLEDVFDAKLINATPTAITAEFVTPVLRFIDDFSVQANGEGVCHVTSSSRVGFWDLGVNRRRVETLRAALHEAKLVR